jgi:hypothetical protein
MPRKKDGMKYQLLPRPTKGKDGKPLLYARPAIGVKYSMRTIDEFCHLHRGMHAGEMTRAFRTFLEVAAFFMAEGARIETPIGSFAPKLKLDGDYTDPKQVKSKNVHFAGFDYQSSKEFREVTTDNIQLGFLQVGEPADTDKLRDTDAMDEALRLSMHQGYTTVSVFQYYSGLKYHTARNYLNSLCTGEKPRLRKRKEGSVMHYLPASHKDE